MPFCSDPEPGVPPPSVELMVLSALILHMSKGCPKRAERIIDGMQSGLATILELQPAIRIRAAKHDTDAQRCLREAQVWLAKVAPAIKLVVGR